MRGNCDRLENMRMHINGQLVTLGPGGSYWVASVGPDTAVTCTTAFEVMTHVVLLLEGPA